MPDILFLHCRCHNRQRYDIFSPGTAKDGAGAARRLEREQERALVVKPVARDLGKPQFEEACAFGVAGAVEGGAEAGEGAQAAEMGDGALPGGESGLAVVEDAFWRGEKDLIFAGYFEEEEALITGEGHPARLAGELFRMAPFFQQEVEEVLLPFRGLPERFGEPAADVGGIGELR